MVDENLNALSNRLIKTTVFSSKNQGIKFYSGQLSSILKKLLSSIAPNGKVAFVAKGSTITKLGVLLNKTVKECGGVLTTFAIDDFMVSTENASNLFSLPEDVRAVVLCDSELSDIVYYYASAKEIPVVLVPQSLDCTDLIKSKVYIKTENKIHGVLIRTKSYVILDDELIVCDFAKAYASIMSKFLFLIDYRLSHAITGKVLNKEYFDTIKQSVLSTYNPAKHKGVLKQSLLYNSFAIAIANYSLKSDVAEFSAERVATVLSKTQHKSGASLMFAIRLIGIYSVLCLSSQEFLSLTNANSIAESIEEKLGIKSEAFSSNIIEQIKQINKNIKDIKEKLDSLKGEINSFVRLGETIWKNYTSLGGGVPQIDDFTFSILHAGDYFEGVNGMSLVREEGLLKEVLV